MRYKSKLLSIFVTCFVLFLLIMPLLAGCAKPAPTPAPVPESAPKPAPAQKPTKDIIIAGTPTVASSSYAMIVGMAELMSKNITELPYKVNATVTPIAAVTDSFKRLHSKEVDMCWQVNAFAYLAIRGVAAFKGIGKVPMRVLFWGGPNIYHVMTTDPNIKSIKDMKGKRVSGWRVDSPTSEALRKALFELHGMSDDDVKLVAARNSGESFQHLKEGVADVAMTVDAWPVSGVQEAIAVKQIYWISLSPEELEILAKLQPYRMTNTMPAGTYKGQDYDVIGSGGYGGIFSRPDLDETLAYEIMKAIYDHEEDFFAIHAYARTWPLEDTHNVWMIPYHPGAIKYYKEKGLWNSEMEAKQKDLIDKFG